MVKEIFFICGRLALCAVCGRSSAKCGLPSPGFIGKGLDFKEVGVHGSGVGGLGVHGLYCSSSRVVIAYI